MDTRIICRRCLASSEKKRVSPAEKIGIWHCAAVLCSQVPKTCTDLDLSLLYILNLGTYSKFVRENNFLALGVLISAASGLLERWLQVCRVKITFKEPPTNRFVSQPKSIKCVDIPLRIRVRSRIPNPTLTA